MTTTEYDTSRWPTKKRATDKGWKPRQLQMIAVGGAIGAGLFMGAGRGAFEAIPQWTIALIALTVNMISVKVFGEMEFWAALIEVVALVTFPVVGIVFLAGRFTVEGQPTGVSVVADNGGILPTGILQLVIITSGVIFAYAAVELVGTRQAKPRTRQRSRRRPSTRRSSGSRCSTSGR